MGESIPTLKLPFTRIDGLPPTAQYQIRRDFEEVAKAAAGGVSLYDAVIDPTGVNNASAHTYTNITQFTVGEAARLVPGNQLTVAVIGHPGTPVVETSNITLGGPVNFIGSGPSQLSPFGSPGSRAVIDFNGHSITSASITGFTNLELQSSSAVAQIVTGSIALFDSMVECVAAGVQTIGTIATALLYARNTGFNGNTVHGAVRTYCFDCVQRFSLVNNVVSGSSQYFVWDGGSFETTPNTGCGVSVVCAFFIHATSDTFMGGSSSSNFLTFTLATGATGTLDIRSVSTNNPVLTITALCGDVTVEGVYASVFVTGNTNAVSRNIKCTVPGGGGVDVTGPLNLAVALDSPSTVFPFVKLRGTGIRADISILSCNAAAPVPLQLIGAIDCLVTMQYPHGGGQSAYSIDASSANCLLVLAGSSDGWAAGTNAGTNCLVITETFSGGGAPSGPAGGALAGTYPNPTFAGRDSTADKLQQDMVQPYIGELIEGINFPMGQVAGYALPLAAPSFGQVLALDNVFTHRWIWETPMLSGNTAAGSLAGTYPNPTFAGRDSSVDALNKDMTQDFLMMAR